MFCDPMGCTERHKDLSEMVRKDLGHMDGVLGHHGEVQGHQRVHGEGLGHGRFLRGPSSMALEPSVTFLYPTGHSSLALESSVTFLYPTGHSSLAPEPSVMSMYPINRAPKLTPGVLTDAP
jgi:hypothetical protein